MYCPWPVFIRWIKGEKDRHSGISAGHQVAPVIVRHEECILVIPELAARRLGDNVEGGPLWCHADGTESRNGGVNDIVPTGTDILIAQALLFEVAGYQVMHENVGHRREPQNDLPAFGLAHVDGNAVLVAIQYGVISLRSGSQIEYHPHRVALRWFDLDDLGAHVSEYLGAARPGNELCNVGYFDSFKNLHEPTSLPDLIRKMDE